ncbi:DUF3509 domain-containing protein [Halopseudomonas pelagia]|uniref:DUF3509 domain-containing protein n=1 Tax=Halopseudomonas pelagia TaxID=553151 RepID=A0AA91U343_9GAMM|nr:DUF3509 domain-containing protein [Halopseudomonas pelagia]PCC99863.1 hypothetical protein CO192_08575 [Halopseudomonas pelagia]QFY56275.1 DUF3509 domain-containing protein [Halopseudomonas pelagia]
MHERDPNETSRLLAGYKVSTETTPNGDLMVVLECPDNKLYKRVVPKDLRDVSGFVHRFKLDMLIDQGHLPRKDILQAVDKQKLPDYLPGTLETTRYARLWEERKLKFKP